jgi:ribosomal protein S18 acetylase RimI-like enzyme
MSDVLIRTATADDLPAILTMLADDQLGATRESLDDLTPYRKAFEEIEADSNQRLVVAERNGEVIGTLQLTFIAGLSRRGSKRGLIEAVRIRADSRDIGLGTTLTNWAIAESRANGCSLVQLTSDKSRIDAHRFYERLGFVASHEGFKLKLG